MNADALFFPLDRARLRALHALGPVARALVVDREKRVAIVGVTSTIVALVLATIAPMWTLAIGPVVLGVPHLVADVRYLIVRPGLHRDRLLWLAAGVPLGCALFFGTWLAFVAAMGAVLVTRGSLAKRALAFAAAGALAFSTYRYRVVADAAFVQVHNLIAVALWWIWRPRTSRWSALVLSTILGGIALIVGGAFDTFVPTVGLGWGSPHHAIHLGALAHSLAPGLSSAIALRLVLLYAFGQSVHYAIWLRMIPEDDRERATPRPFAASFRALTRDFGVYLVVAACLATLALTAYALVDLRAARDGYLRFAASHGYIEIVALMIRLVAVPRPRAEERPG